jgi:hypothetical protein
MKNINLWTRKEFDSLPYRSWNEDMGEFDSIVILPLRRLHDSGFRCLDFVGVKDNVPFCKLSGCSDVIHINGIGGLGKDWLHRYGTIPKTIQPMEWSIDCLKTSGLLRIFTHYKMTVGEALSSFEVYSEIKEK